MLALFLRRIIIIIREDLLSQRYVWHDGGGAKDNQVCFCCCKYISFPITRIAKAPPLNKEK